MKNDRKQYRQLRQGTINFDMGDDTPVVERADAPATAGNERGHGEVLFISMGSGSSGNCSYLGTVDAGVLVDAGIDPALVMATLRRNGIQPTAIKGIVLTHDHQDHVRYAYTIVRNYKHIRIYCTPRLMNGLLRRHNISRRIREYHENIFKEIDFALAGMRFTAFDTSHDGTDNMGFSIQVAGATFVVATDMGYITERAEHYMSQANYLMIESNYDRVMLDTGSYPEYLKSRVRSNNGHLDNEVAAEFVGTHYHAGLRGVFLCHLSNDNNRPEIARGCVERALIAAGATVGDGTNAIDQRSRDVQLYVLPRHEASLCFVID